MSARVFAPAKINLTLQVGRPRADGLHPLQSIVAFADVGDWIEAAPAQNLSLAISGPFAAELASEGDNLVLRAARALAKLARVPAGAAISLEKHLPIAAGVGGGSSDAAAGLKALNDLWGLGMSLAELTTLAIGLGADVPVCVGARAAYMTGAGETFAPFALPELNAVLVNPLEPLATALVFRAFDGQGLGAAFTPQPAPVWRDGAAAVAGVKALGNDLEAPARMCARAIGVISDTLGADARSRCISLSGSGATMFALTENRDDALALARNLQAERPDWWVRAARLA